MKTTLVIAFVAATATATARAHAETQGTGLGYGEYYEVGYAGGQTGLVGNGDQAVSTFGVSFYERRGVVGKAVIGVPVFLAMLMVPAGNTRYLGQTRVHYYTLQEGYVGTARTDWYLYTETQADRDRKTEGMDRAEAAIGRWPMALSVDIVHEKLGSDTNGWLVAFFPLALTPRRGAGGPPILVDLGFAAGHLDPPLADPAARDFDELGLALDVTFPVVRQLQLDVRQRLNLLGGHRGSFGVTANLGNRVYARGAAAVQWDDLSRPLGIRVEGGVRF